MITLAPNGAFVGRRDKNETITTDNNITTNLNHSNGWRD